MTRNNVPLSNARRQAYAHAFFKAGEVLKKGDRVRMIAHGSDRQVTYTFDRWDQDHLGFFISKGGADELHPYNITAVNGEAVDFRYPEAA